MTKKKKRKTRYRQPQLDWNAFIVEWNNLFSMGADIKRASQFFSVTPVALTMRLGQLASLGIYLPRLAGMSEFKNKKWRKAAERIRKNTRPATAPKMLADLASTGMVFRLMPVAAG